MRKTYSFFFLLLLVPLFSYSQEMTGETGKVFLSIETGYFIQAKESFRKNYDQNFLFGTESIPFSLGLEATYKLMPEGTLFLNLKRVNNSLSSDNHILLAVMPAIGGLRYDIIPPGEGLGSWSLFGGMGLGFYWARFTAEYSVSGPNGPEELERVTESEDYFGYGIQLQTGLERMIGNSTNWGFTVAYDIVNAGDVSKGKLGNIGGWYFSSRIGFQF